MVWLMRPLVDSLSAFLASDASALRATALLVAAMAGLMVLSEILRSVSSYLRAERMSLARE